MMTQRILTSSLFIIFLVSCDLEVIPDFFNEKMVATFNERAGGSNNEFPYAVLPEPDGLSYLVVGVTQSYTSDQNNNAYVVRIDTAGNAIDFNHFGFAADDAGHDIARTSEGGYILTGVTRDIVTFNSNVLVVKMNSTLDNVAGQIFSYGSPDSTEVAFGIEPLGNNTFVVGYTATHVNGGDTDIKFMTINGNGAKISNKSGRRGSLTITDMTVTSDNKIVVGGYESVQGTAAYIAKFDSDGDYIWEETFPETNPNYSPGYGVVELSDKSLVLAGSIQPVNDHDFLIVRYSETGEKLMDKSWGGSNDNELLAVTKSHDDKIVVMGYSNALGPSQIYISKRDPANGNEIWEEYHDGPSWVFTADIKLCPDKGFIIATGQNDANADIIVVKTDMDGKVE